MIQESYKSLVLIVAVMQKQGRSLEQIISLLLTHGMEEEAVKELVKNYLSNREEVETTLDQYKTKYSQSLNEEEIEELIVMVTELYAYCDFNSYEVKQHLVFFGVDEVHHHYITEEALVRVQKSTYKEGNLKIVIGIVISLIGLPILAVGIAAGIGKIAVIPFGFGLSMICWGALQRNAI
jgi:hypothetical protein